MGIALVADSPKSRISCRCSQAAELKLWSIDENTLHNFQARFISVQLIFDLNLRGKGVNKTGKYVDWKIQRTPCQNVCITERCRWSVETCMSPEPNHSSQNSVLERNSGYILFLKYFPNCCACAFNQKASVRETEYHKNYSKETNNSSGYKKQSIEFVKLINLTPTLVSVSP